MKTYIVDITKPPIFPPNTEWKDHWIKGLIETDESIENRRNYQEYMMKYRTELEKRKLIGK